jgi:ACS family glucarate transporter-like MFS transporter
MVNTPPDRQPAATRVRHLVLAWLCAAALIVYVQRNSIGVVIKQIGDDLGLTEDGKGQVLSAFFLSYAFLQLPTGWLGHVWGTRRALTLFVAAGSLVSALAGFAEGVVVLLLARLGMGAAQAGVFPCTTSSVGKWFPAVGRALPNGAIGGFMSFGGALGAALTGLLLEQGWGWRAVFALFALPGLAWAAGFWLWFRDRPQDHAAVNAAERALILGPAPQPRPEEPPEPTPWLGLLTSPTLACICGQQFFRAAGYIFFSTWFATFLQETHGVSVGTAGVLSSLPLWVVVFGSLAGGAVSDGILARTGSLRLSRQGLAVVSMAGCAALILLSYPIGNVWLAVLVISAGSFCASLAGPCAYAVTIDMGGRHVATVFATMNMAGNVGAMLFPLVVPQVVRWTGEWEAVLFLFAGMYVGAATCWLCLNPDGTVFHRGRDTTHPTSPEGEGPGRPPR